MKRNATARVTAVSSGLLLAALTLGSGACGWAYTPEDNVLPTGGGSESSSTTNTTLPTTETEGMQEDVPATYRFDCVEIISLGDADTEVFQVIQLQDTWTDDIANFRLSILIDLLELDEEAGEATMTVRSGVGSGWSNLCSEPSTESQPTIAGFDPNTSIYAPIGDGGAENQCIGDGAGMASSGSYTLELGKDDIISIYAEDDMGTAFTCSLEGGPNAIPVRGVSATITMSEDRNTIAGTLVGCMTEAEAMARCSCLGFCGGQPNPNCPGCPDGAVPLGALLGGIGPTDHCTELVGETAFDVVLEFTAQRLGAVPDSCSG